MDGTALGGAHPKAFVCDEQGVLWLAKFASRYDGFDVLGIEAAALQLAQRTGLNVLPVRTIRLGQRRIMLGPQGRLDNALASCERFTLSRATVCQLVVDVWGVVRQWRVCFDEFGTPAAEQGKIASAFRHLDDISTPALRRQLP